MELLAVKYTRWNCGQYWPKLELTFHIAKSYNIGIKTTLDLTKSLKCPTIPPCITVGCFVTCKWTFLLERLLISYKLRVQPKLTEIIHILTFPPFLPLLHLGKKPCGKLDTFSQDKEKNRWKGKTALNKFTTVIWH